MESGLKPKIKKLNSPTPSTPVKTGMFPPENVQTAGSCPRLGEEHAEKTGGNKMAASVVPPEPVLHVKLVSAVTGKLLAGVDMLTPRIVPPSVFSRHSEVPVPVEFVTMVIVLVNGMLPVQP